MLTLIAAIVLVAPAEATPSVAILDLVNATGDPTFDGAGPGVAGLLVTRFQQTPSVSVVERDALQAVMTELKLSNSGMVDPASAVRTGKLTGARYLVTGEIFSIKLPTLSINLRVIDTESGEVVASNEVIGEIGEKGENFFVLVDQLSEGILEVLDVKLSEDERAGWSQMEHRELNAVIKYGKRLTHISLDNPMALYRDKSKDSAVDYYSYQWNVMDNSGAELGMPAFSRRVGDEEMVRRYNGELYKNLAAHKRSNLIVVGELVGGLGLAIAGGASQNDGVGAAMGATGGLILFGSLFHVIGNQVGRYSRLNRLSYPGSFYTPEDADRWIAEYNIEL